MTEKLQKSKLEPLEQLDSASEFDSWSPETAETLNDLLRALRRKKGFGLFFVQCNPAQGQRMVTAIKNRLPQKRLVQVELHRESETLYGELLEYYQTEPFEIVCVTGTEQAMYGYEDTKRLAGWTSEEIYNYSWKGLPPLLGHLNRQREAFEENLPVALIFLVPSFVIDYFVQRAPDFFDWRSGFFKFNENLEDVRQASQELIDQDYRDYISLSPEQRTKIILEIKDKIIQTDPSDNQQKSNLLREQGRVFSSGGDDIRALDCYERAIEANPENYKAWNSKGVLLTEMGRHSEAIENHKKALRIKPDYYDALIGIGAAHSKQGKHQDSISSYEKVLEMQPDNFLALYNRGVVLGIIQRHEDAFKSYERALKANSKSHLSWHGKGHSLSNLRRYRKAIYCYDKAIAIQPIDHYSWVGKGNALIALKRYRNAVDCFSRAIEIQPDHFYAWAGRAKAFSKQKLYGKAFKDYARAVEIQPENPYIWVQKGNLFARLGFYEDAIYSYNRALKNEPQNSLTLFSRAWAFLWLDQYEEASVSFARHIYSLVSSQENWYFRLFSQLLDKVNPSEDFEGQLEQYGVLKDNASQILNFASALQEILRSWPGIRLLKWFIVLRNGEFKNKVNNHSSLSQKDYIDWDISGQDLHNLGAYKEAIDSYDLAVKDKPDYCISWKKRGDALCKLEKYDEAISSYDKALKINPSFYSAWTNRGDVFYRLERYQEAVVSYGQALKLNSDSYETWMDHGTSLRCLEKYEEAIVSYDHALRINPDSHHAWNSKGYLFYLLGSHQESLECFHKVIQIKPDQTDAWNSLGYLTMAKYSYGSRPVFGKPLLIRQDESCDGTPIENEIDPEFCQAALAFFDTALNLDLEFSLALANRCFPAYYLQQCQTALQSCDKTISLITDEEEEMSDVLYNNRGCILLKLQESEPAFQAFTIALELNPQLDEAWIGKGTALYQLERYEEAIHSFTQALHLNHPLAQVNLDILRDCLN